MSPRNRSNHDEMGPGSTSADTIPGAAPFGGAFDMAGHLAMSANAFRTPMGPGAPPVAIHANAVQAVRAKEAQHRADGFRKQAVLVAIAQSFAGRQVPGSAMSDRVV